MNRKTVFLLALAVGFASLSVRSKSSNSARAEDKPAAAAATIVPVDANMHDFMEGVFQGPYRRLKTAMATEPTDKSGWKTIRSEAIILAEGGNLLLTRKPEKDVEKWVEFSVAVRETGSALRKAARQNDFAASKKAYESMLTHCNACHKHFDDGKNQLAP